MPDELYQLTIPITEDSMALASGYVIPSGRSIGPTIPVTTIASGIVPYQGVAYTIYETYTIPVPSAPVPSGTVTSGGDEDINNLSIPIPIAPSGGTENYSEPGSSILLSGPLGYYIPIPSPSEVTDNNFDGKFSIASTYTIPIPITTYDPDMETIFDFDKVFSYVGTNYLDQTDEAKDYITNDVDLIRVGAGAGDGIMVGAYDPNWMGVVVIVSTAGTGAYTLIWEYWNGASWSAVTTINEYGVVYTGHFKTLGYYRVKFDSPPYWDPYALEIATDVFTDELYWLRCRIVTTGVTIRPLGTRIWGRRLRVRLKNARQTMNDTPGTYYMTYMPINGIIYRVGPKYYWEFKMVDYADYASPRSYITPRVSVSYGGRAFISVNNPITEMVHGWYMIEIPAQYFAEQVILKAIGPGAAQSDMTVDITPGIIINYYNTWGEVAVLTWGEVAIKTWRQLRINTI